MSIIHKYIFTKKFIMQKEWAPMDILYRILYICYRGIALMVFDKSPKGDKKRSIIILVVCPQEVIKVISFKLED